MIIDECPAHPQPRRRIAGGWLAAVLGLLLGSAAVTSDRVDAQFVPDPCSDAVASVQPFETPVGSGSGSGAAGFGFTYSYEVIGSVVQVTAGVNQGFFLFTAVRVSAGIDDGNGGVAEVVVDDIVVGPDDVINATVTFPSALLTYGDLTFFLSECLGGTDTTTTTTVPTTTTTTSEPTTTVGGGSELPTATTIAPNPTSELPVTGRTTSLALVSAAVLAAGLALVAAARRGSRLT